MLATNKLTIPFKDGFVISKGKTIFALHKHTSHDLLSRSRLLCFTNKNCADKCLNYIIEFSRTYSDLPPRNIDSKLNVNLVKTPLLYRADPEREKKTHNLKVNKVDINFLYNHCKYNDIALWVCDDFRSNINDIRNGIINYDVSSVELIDPLTSFDTQVVRLEECLKYH